MRNIAHPRPISVRVSRRRRTQAGQELMEFALVFGLILAPMFLGMIVYGMNLVRSNQVNFLCRDVGSLYIGGTDLSTANAQKLVASLATGLDLQVGTTGGAANTGNAGSGLVTITEVMWVGALTDATCANISPCNSSNFVYLQRVQFGNASASGAPPSIVGTPSGVTTNTAGIVANAVRDPNAKLSGTALSGLTALFNPGGTTGVGDGQTIYVIETYFASSGFSFGTGTKGIYSKYFF